MLPIFLKVSLISIVIVLIVLAFAKLSDWIRKKIKEEEMRGMKWQWWMRGVTVAGLRRDGWDVKVEHHRLVVPPTEDEDTDIPCVVLMSDRDQYHHYGSLQHSLPCGGKTVVKIFKNIPGTEKKFGEFGEGLAVCSEVDNYCRKEGVGRALDRALDDAGIPRPEDWRERFYNVRDLL